MPSYPYSVPIVNAGSGATGITTTTGWTQLVGSGMAGNAGGSPGYLRPGANLESQVGQYIDLDPDLYADIDSGLLSVSASYLGTGFSSDNDAGRLDVEFFTGAAGAGNRIAEMATQFADHPTYSATTTYSVGPMFLPAGTRSIKLSLQAVRSDGTNNDAYARQFAVTLSLRAKPAKQVEYLTGSSTTGFVKSSGSGTLTVSGNWAPWHGGLPGLVGVSGTWLGRKDIDISTLPALALADIDAGGATLGFYGMGGTFNGIDAMTVQVQALDAGGSVISTIVNTGSVVYSSRGRFMAYAVAIPAGTRKLRLIYNTTGTDGANADGFMSRISMMVEANNVLDAVVARRRHAAGMMLAA
jgi:hypothetical protein